MNIRDYINESERTERKFPGGRVLSSAQMASLHAIMGIQTESGELTDQFKRHLIYDADLDLFNIEEEIGDMMWYVAILCREYHIDFEQIIERNIEKLRRRFPEKFDSEKALNRDHSAEREALEGETATEVRQREERAFGDSAPPLAVMDFTAKEGSDWRPFPVGTKTQGFLPAKGYGKADCVLVFELKGHRFMERVHAIRLMNGAEWDCMNGWHRDNNDLPPGSPQVDPTTGFTETD